MKLLILTDGIAPFVIGGMQKHSFYLSKNLSAAGHQITLIHCVYDQKPLPTKEDIVAAFGIENGKQPEVITLRFPPAAWYPGHYLKESYIYSKMIFEKLKSRLNEFDFIYAKGFTAWYFIQKKKGGLKLPPIGVKFHGYEMFQAPANFRSRIHNWMLAGPTRWNNLEADYVFSYGGKITDIIKKIGVSEKKIIEIPTGIEAGWCLDRILAMRDTVIHFAFVGRNERRKGIEELTEVLRKLTKTHEFHFHFIGPIPPSSWIKSDKITYHGSISNFAEIQQILDKCQVLVVPSHSEGMPNVIMEGMARGLAIAATDVGAVRSVVNDANGWFIIPGDIDDLEAKMLEILRTPESTITTKRNASIQSIRHFFWEHIATETAEQIEKRLL